ncbi:hypothetical protein HYPSUDRAFT_1070518, partial [Hypholoma sublateritium FD-334 SS-4]
ESKAAIIYIDNVEVLTRAHDESEREKFREIRTALLVQMTGSIHPKCFGRDFRDRNCKNSMGISRSRATQIREKRLRPSPGLRAQATDIRA